MKKQFFKRIILVPAVAGLAVLVASMSQAHEGGVLSDSDMSPKKHMRQIMSQLDLSMDQKLSVRATMMDTRDEMSVIREDLKKMRSEMMELLKSGNVSQQSIDAVLNQYESSLRQMAKTGANTKNAVYSILNDEQRAKAQELIANKQARFAARDPEQRLNKLAEKLDFSEQQLASATELLPEIVAARTALRDTVKSFREAQRDLIVTDNLSDEQLDALFDAHFPEFKSNLFTAIQAHQQLFQLLTDEQKEEIKGRKERMFLPRMI